MMTDQQYNDFFRNRLDDFSSPVPDHLWKNIKSDNQNDSGKWLTSAKYILLALSLIIALKTADKLTTSVTQQNKNLLYTMSDKQDSIYSSTWKDAADKRGYINPEDQSQRSADYNSHEKKEGLKSLSALSIRKRKQGKSNAAVSGTMNENKDPAALFFKEKTDSITNQAVEIKMEPAPQKQSGSTAGIVIKTHESSDRLSLYLFASPDAVFSHVSADNKSYQQQRNREARSQFSWSAGARVRYNVNAHWSGNIGFQFSAINEKIALPDKTSQNHYTSIDVPLITGYRIYKNRFQVDANVGIIFNISSAYKGYISSVSNEPLDIHKENIYKENTSLSYYGGFQFLYRPANRISLFAEPYVRYQPQNIANSFQPFEERVQKTGVLLGVRYRFDK